MLAARGPLGLCSTSYCTLSFSFSVLNPLAWMDEKCTKRSLLPSSGVMKPKPLASLNHFTVPVLMSVSLKSIRRRAQSEESRPCGKSRREPTDEDSTNRYDPTSYSLLENPTVPLYRYSSAQSNLARARPGHALAAAADRADALVDEFLQALALVGLGRVEVAFRVGGDAVHAVGAPVALHPAGVGVEHGDALVLVAVGDERLVGLRVDEDLRRAAEVLQVVAALVVAVLAHLQQELAVLGELQHLRVLRAVAADPDVTLVVDEDAVVRLRPLVAGARAAPVPHQVAGGRALVSAADRAADRGLDFLHGGRERPRQQPAAALDHRLRLRPGARLRLRLRPAAAAAVRRLPPLHLAPRLQR